MQSWTVFMVCLVFLTMFGPVQSTESPEYFLSIKEKEVQAIAAQAEINYANTCELVSTCQTQQNCSRRECHPIESQNNDYDCVYVNNNTRCHNRTGSPCNSLKADFQRGFVRIPPLDLQSGGTPELFLGNTICAQRELDSRFIGVKNSLLASSSQLYFYNLYFGSVDGAFRYYPGREVFTNSCGEYDPRIRPWYTGTISVLKDVVVLLDTGKTMAADGLYFEASKTSLEIAKSMTEMLLQTLTAGDRVTVIPVNESGSGLVSTSSQYNVPGDGLDLNETNFQELIAYVLNDSAFSGHDSSNGMPSNFTAGFKQALSIIKDSSSPTSSLKIVILITDSSTGNSPSLEDSTAAKLFQKSGSRLFVYDLSKSNVSGWDEVACPSWGSSELELPFRATVVANSLLSMSSYFSFLARSRIAANNGSKSSFWSKPYIDATDLGRVITVGYPAMSPDGELIGVAGIDVQTAGLDPVLQFGIEYLLAGSSRTIISRYPAGAIITKCAMGYQNACSGVVSGSTQSLCSSNTATDMQLTNLYCCKDCSNASQRKVVFRALVGMFGGLFVLLLLSVFYSLHRFRTPKHKKDVRPGLTLNKYSYEVLRTGTRDFDPSNIIGKGAFGVVYKACLGDEMVAVKQLKQPVDRAEDFQAELKILGITSHPNLVELKGTCFQTGKCFLVYELVESGDLHSWLWPRKTDAAGYTESDASSSQSGRFLTWSQRKKIARGVASGLGYLHHGLLPNGKAFHLDIKPRNILLEDDLNPKIADFGISQLYEPGYTFRDLASVVRGTFGYIAPEVLQGQMKPNSKLDVYSYGMVLLQLASGRKIDDPQVHPFLLQWARDQVKVGNVDGVIDNKLVKAVQDEDREVLMANCRVIIRLALRCLSESPELRPEMSEILETMDSLQQEADLNSPSSRSSSDSEEGRPACEVFERSMDVIDLIPTKSKSGRSLARLSSGENTFSFRNSERRSSVGRMQKNSERLQLTRSHLTVAGRKQDYHHSRSSSRLSLNGWRTPTESLISVESSYQTALEIQNAPPERQSRQLRRISSYS